MKTRTRSIATLIIVALIALAIPQAQAGENILANGTITIAAGDTTGSNIVELTNIKGQEWGEIAAFRYYNGSGTQSFVKVTCEDTPLAPITFIESESTGTNTPSQVAKSTVFTVAGTNLFAKKVKVVVSLRAAYTNAASSMPWFIYAK
jgi:hypothetical protein